MLTFKHKSIFFAIILHAMPVTAYDTYQLQCIEGGNILLNQVSKINVDKDKFAMACLQQAACSNNPCVVCEYAGNGGKTDLIGCAEVGTPGTPGKPLRLQKNPSVKGNI